VKTGSPPRGLRRYLKVVNVLAVTLLFLFVYVLAVGSERFFIESWGTLIVSPGIYPRLLPVPFDSILRRFLIAKPAACVVLQVLPLILLALAFLSAMVALYKNSLRMAILCMAIVAVVFGVYHHLQPMGITLVLF